MLCPSSEILKYYRFPFYQFSFFQGIHFISQVWRWLKSSHWVINKIISSSIYRGDLISSLEEIKGSFNFKINFYCLELRNSFHRKE